MKNLKMFLTASAVLAIVGSALAFNAKTFISGNVWCFSSSFTPIPGQSCSNQSQVGTQPGFNTADSGSPTSPCASGTNAFINDGATCTPPANGTEYQSE